VAELRCHRDRPARHRGAERALDSREDLPGPIYLQGSEEGHVAFRNIVVTPALP
jgi:hypothetical protein